MGPRLIIVTLAFALAGCGQLGLGGARAPAHPSQSPASTGVNKAPTQQVRISAENRQQVENNIREQLTQFSGQYAPGGVAIQGFQDVVTAIQPGTDIQARVSLAGGTHYAFVGVCDADCNNVDMELLDGRTGEVVASDLLPDDYPVVQYTPAANANYFVRLILRTCTQAPCYIGARGLQQPTGK
jgi:hypothetical protein